MSGKYTPLDRYLRSIPEDTREITLSFDRIEQILMDKLPKSAFLHPAWWANEVGGTHVHANSWISAGWSVKGFSQREKWVRFKRDQS